MNLLFRKRKYHERKLVDEALDISSAKADAHIGTRIPRALTRGFLLALQLLTIIPIPGGNDRRPRELASSMPYFPLIGVVIGFCLLGLYWGLVGFLSAQVTAILLVIAMTLLTGGLHVDGLADSADALFSRKSRVEKLRIMKDSAIGAFGATAIILVLMLKVSLLASLSDELVVKALLLFPAVGRFCMLPVAALFNYARSEGGSGQAYVGKPMWTGVICAALFTGALAYGLAGGVGLAAFAAALALSLLAGRMIAGAIGGMTGDTLGMINELGEIVFLIAALSSTGLPVWE